MRIIAGEFRSRRLVTPKGLETRPTLDATRESLFNILQGKLAGTKVLDLFAGSGSLGLEAISRGAQSAVFCDKSNETAKALRSNIINLQVEDRTELMVMDWSLALDKLALAGKRFHFIFMDPPYMATYEPVIDKIEKLGLLEKSGQIILERDIKQAIALPENLLMLRTKEYRHTAIDFIGRRQEI